MDGTGWHCIRQLQVEMKTEKYYLYFRFLFFFETEAGLKNTGSKTESKYTDIRKRTNTNGEPKN
jgi:hypothetical protein